MIQVVLIVAFPVCFIVILIGCLDCLVRKRKLEAFRSRDSTDGRQSAAFAVDICAIPSASEQVTIEPLPDILSKVSAAPPLRPQITYAERGKHESTVPVASVQRSFPRDHLTYLNEIGSGWFGKAIESEAIQIVGGSYKSHVVVKMLKDDASKVEQKQFLDEVHAFRCLEHANLVSLLGQCTESTPYLVILEFAAHGSLKNYLVQNSQDLDEIVAKNRFVSFALDAASGLACLHRHDYIHNDLAARNCLVMSDYTLKIGDYGVSDHLYKNEYYNTGSELFPIRWMAPETLNKADGGWTVRSHDKTSDMWSFGILLWEICSLGERPYDMLTDEAVLQGVILDRLLLPSDADIKLPFKDKLWSIMTQCWQNPSDRLDVEQAYKRLEQLSRIRLDTMDTMSDFDQKWNQLKLNQGSDTDLGSRIALAGSFVTNESSSPSDKPSLLDGDNEAPDFVRGDDLIIDMGVDSTYSSRSHDEYNQSVPTILVQHSQSVENPSLTIIQHADISNNSQDQIVVENELTWSQASPSHSIPTESPERAQTTTSTPVFQGQSLTSNFFSSDSSLDSETVVVPSKQKKDFKDFSSVEKDFSLGVRENTFQEPQKPVENGSDETKFEVPPQAEDEEFSEFVRTSPTAPATDFTDFAYADKDLSVKTGFVNDGLKIEKDASVDVEPTAGVNETDNSFSEFAATADENSSSENDMNTFSDFVTSAPPGKRDSAKDISAELETTAPNDIKVDLAHSLAGKEMPSSLDSDMFASVMSSFVHDPESYNKNENISTPSPDPDIHSQIQEVVKDLEHEGKISSVEVNIVQEKISTEKLSPDQNQNIFSSEQIPSNASLTSDASFLLNDIHLGTASEISPIQSREAFIDLLEHSEGVNSLEPIHAHVPATREVLEESNTDIFLALDDNSSAFSSVDFLDQRLLSGPTQTTGLAALTDDKTQGDHKTEPDIHGEKSETTSDLVNHLADVSIEQGTVTQNGSEQAETFENLAQGKAEPVEVEGFMPAEDLLGLELSPQSVSSHSEQGGLLTETQASNGGTDIASAQETERSLIDF